MKLLSVSLQQIKAIGTGSVQDEAMSLPLKIASKLGFWLQDWLIMDESQSLYYSEKLENANELFTNFSEADLRTLLLVVIMASKITLMLRFFKCWG